MNDIVDRLRRRFSQSPILRKVKDHTGWGLEPTGECFKEKDHLCFEAADLIEQQQREQDELRGELNVAENQRNLALEQIKLLQDELDRRIEEDARFCDSLEDAQENGGITINGKRFVLAEKV